MNFTYTYDKLGNITQIVRGDGNKITYAYDALGQLVRENDQAANRMVVYTYDKGGNMVSKTFYAYTTSSTLGTALSTVTYSYNDAAWTDLMTSYNGQTITYDQIGNPLTYRDGMSFTWQNGREMKSATVNGTTINYKYNENGIRTQKSTSGNLINYVLDGDELVGIDTKDYDIVFYIDENGTKYGFRYIDENGVAYSYYYVFNVQGDVIALLNGNGTLVAKYTYDAWASH